MERSNPRTLLLGDEFTWALEDLRGVTRAAAVRLIKSPAGFCCPDDCNTGVGELKVALHTTSGAPPVGERPAHLVIASHPPELDGAVRFCSYARVQLTTGETLDLCLGFSDPPPADLPDPPKLTRLCLPVLMWARHATERQVAAARLAEIEERWPADLPATVKAQEEEREWLAYEIHDRVAQTLASTFQHLQAAEGLARPLPEIRQLVVRASMLCREAMREVRNIMNELRPAVLAALGLVPLMEEELQRLQEDTGCPVQANLTCAARAPQDTEVVAYRILHEALANIRRHAQAGEVVVSLECNQGEVRFQVEDNGVGFDVAAALGEKRVGGLMSMQRRAYLAGGNLHLQSKPGRGTTVSGWLPWPEWRREEKGK